jgi:MFS family permease
VPSSDLREPGTDRRFFSFSQGITGDFRRYLYSTFAGNLALPIYSLFLPLLASRLGASLFEIGIVGGASNVVYSFMPFIMGHFSDRRGSRRFFIISSFVVLTIVSISYVFISNPLDLIMARVFEGVGWAMLWPAMDAAVSRDVVAPMDARKALSIYNVSWSGAAAAGPLLGSALIFFASIRIAFLLTVLIMGVTLAVNLVPLIRHEGEIKHSKLQIEHNAIEIQKTDSRPTNNTPSVGSMFYVVSIALGAVSNGVLFTFFAPYARSLGISILLVGVITFVFGFGRFLFYVLSTNDRVRHAILRPDRRIRNMMVALALASVSSLLVSIRDPSGMLYLVAYGVVGVGISIIYAIGQAGIIVESAPGKFGRSAGLFESSIGIGACAGPIIGGAISGSSLAVPFLVPPCGFLIFLLLFPLITRKIMRSGSLPS